ncbi:hypothetical protein [Pseudomonas xanthosomatis]|uniref:hypothetical protein n=1 Tax=Pseudomonas xanthosomatis TaxID=2842356 RepID=UPI003515A384
MAKKSNKAKSVPVSEQSTSRAGFRHIKKFWLALFAATASAVWGGYQGWLSSVIEQKVPTMWTEFFDKPMPENYLIRLDLRFGLQENSDVERYERARVTLWPARCRQDDGDTLTRTFDSNKNSHQDVILQVKCNYSGHVKVTLTPLFGEKATIYEGLPLDQETHTFVGVPGSYRFGQLQITRVYKKDTTWVPVNKCQLMNNCDEFDPRFPD